MKPNFELWVAGFVLSWPTAAIVLALSGCKEKAFSEERYEEGQVALRRYEPEQDNSHWGLNYDGNLEWQVDITPERYRLMFHCEHGENFEVASDTARRLFHLREGEEVIITYRQIDTIERDKDGKITHQDFHDYDFITAHKLDRKGPKEQP